MSGIPLGPYNKAAAAAKVVKLSVQTSELVLDCYKVAAKAERLAKEAKLAQAPAKLEDSFARSAVGVAKSGTEAAAKDARSWSEHLGDVQKWVLQESNKHYWAEMKQQVNFNTGYRKMLDAIAKYNNAKQAGMTAEMNAALGELAEGMSMMQGVAATYAGAI